MATKSVSAKPGGMKSTRSLTTAKTLAFSAVNFSDGRITNELAGEQVFEEALPNLCYKYNCCVPVMVKKEFRQDDYLKRLRATVKSKPKTRVIVPLGFSSQEDQKASKVADTARSHDSVTDPRTKIITAIYDDMSLNLCEVSLTRLKSVPRVLIQSICLLAPIYVNLIKITITKCHIDVYTIHELQKFLPQTFITEVCLDESPLAEGIYALLLDNGSKLRTLSLCRCKINDTVCSEIASKLQFTMGAEKTLQVLDLSSNHITNAGAKHLGDALRSNRHLRYLGLADNRIGDEGAIQIFNVLKEFPLTSQEMAGKRFRYTTYLKSRMRLYLQFLHSLMEEDKQKKPVGKKKYFPMTPSYLKMRAEEMAGKALGSFSDPFAAQYVVRRDGGAPHCRGNNVLCYINLAYNELSYLSVKSLLTVVTYQSLVLNFSDIGLLRIIIDGNSIPETCSELATISELMNKNTSRFAAVQTASLGRRKSRISRISMVPAVPGELTSLKASDTSKAAIGSNK